MSTVIATSGLVKRYGRLRAVDGIDLDVRAGDVYGFLGANGSGKTTTVRMLLGLVLPTKGEVQLLGEPMPKAARRVLPRVGALVEGPAFHPYLSGSDNLRRWDAADRTAGARCLPRHRHGHPRRAGRRRRRARLSGGGRMSAEVIRTRGLVKRFGRLRAVDGIDLDVLAGDIYGFLGANGSGKTTTVRMLLGLVLPTAGEIELLGERMPRGGRRVLPRVGSLVEGPAHYGHLSGRANLALLDASGPGGSWRTRRRRIDEVLEQVGLAGIGRRPVRAYSLGMRQRLGLAGALLRRPEVLVLDEPTNGLDPQGIAEIRELLLDLHRGGTTVFLSSHLLAEVEQLCSRVGVLDRGRLVLQDELASLTAPTGATVVRTPVPDRVRATLDGRVTEIDGECVVVRGHDPAEVNALLVAAGVPVTGLALQRPTLEEVVLAAARATADRVEAPSGESR